MIYVKKILNMSSYILIFTFWFHAEKFLSFLKGSSVGIGAVTAVEFAKEGASVVLVGRNSGNLDKTAKQCQEAGLKQNQVENSGFFSQR